MSLAECLALERIGIGLTPVSKRDALECIAALLAAPEGDHREEILQAISEREKLGTTGVGSHVAMPHGRLPNGTMRAALLLCPDGVPFDAIDGQDVKIFVGLIAPSSHPAQLLQLLADASRVLRSSEARDRLLNSRNREDALSRANTLWR